MNSKALTGLLLAVGPILMAVAIFGFPGTGSGDEGTAVIVGKIAENIGLHRVGTLFELAGLVAMMTGWIFLAHSMHGDGKPGNLLAKVAVILPLICLPIAVASTGLSLSVGWAIEDGLMAEAGMLYGVSEGIAGTIFNVLGISWILIGIAIVLQKNLHLILGIVVIIIGAAMFVANIADNDIIWMIAFLGMLIGSLATGILSIINRNVDYSNRNIVKRRALRRLSFFIKNYDILTNTEFSLSCAHLLYELVRSNIMISFWKIQLSKRQVITIIIGIIAAIYIVWYVFDALEGFNPDYRPMRPASTWAPKTGNEFFDPSKETPEAQSPK